MVISADWNNESFEWFFCVYTFDLPTIAKIANIIFFMSSFIASRDIPKTIQISRCCLGNLDIYGIAFHSMSKSMENYVYNMIIGYYNFLSY